MQCHGEPTKYIFWGFGSAMFNTSWKHYNKEYFISEEMSTEDIAMRTIAIELAKNRTATTFYFDNIVFEIYHEDPSVVMLWNNIVTNSDLEGDDVSCFKATVKRGGENFIDYAPIVDGAGKGNSRGIVVESKDNPPESWDTQFFVCLPQSVPAGTKYRFSFDHKASQDAPITMQCHDEPSDYIYYGFGGDFSITTSWGHYEHEGYITSEMSTDEKKMRTIAIDLAHNTTATTFYFDNIVFEIEQPQEEEDESVTITADSKAMTYGDDVPTLTFRFSGATLKGTPELSTTATKTSPVGKYPIKVERGTVTNEQVTFVDGTLTISKAALYVGVQDVTITEGDAIPSFDLTYRGFCNDDTEANAFTTYPTARTTATSSSKPGTYPITVSGGSATNYSLTYTQGTLTILAKAATTSWENIVKNSDLEGDDVSCFFVREDLAKDSLILNATIVNGAGKDNSRGIVVHSVDDASEGWNTQFFVRLPQSLPVGAKYRFSFDHKASQDASVNMEVHQEPSDYIYWGFGSTTCTTSWDHYENEGVVTLEMSTDEKQMRTIAIDLAGNATATTFYFDNIVFEVYNGQGEDESATITADDKTMVYGDDLPTLTYTSSGVALEGTPKLTTTATKTSPVGTYPIKVERGTVTNGQVTYVYGILTITKAPLTAKADDKTMQQGDKVPSLTISYSGWKLDETENVLKTKPTAKTTANSQSEPGTYRITVSGGEAQNYDFTYESGTLTVLQTSSFNLSISSTGNGYVAYDGNTVRGKMSTFSVGKGTDAILKFIADDGNRLKSVKVNGKDVTSTIVNNQYTVSDISASTSIEVAFEAIPTYSLNIVASGNGKAVYGVTTIRNQSRDFTLQEGVSAVVSFTPDEGYRIKSVIVNNIDRTSQVSNGQITISNIKQDTNVEVSFEEIPPTTHYLRITVSDNGSVTYDGNSVRGTTKSFDVVEGSYVTIKIEADEGYQLKSVKVNSTDVTANVVNGQYTTDKIMAFTRLNVEFEAIPTFSMTIKSSAFGSVKYGDAVITNRTETFTVKEGTSAVLTFMADDNGRLLHILLNGENITSELTNGQYTISDIRADQNIEAEYEEDVAKITEAGIAYSVVSYDERTVVLAAGNYDQVLTVPSRITAKGKTWRVVGVADDALKDNPELAAIVWKPEVLFSGEVKNPNLLLYVKADQYAPEGITNVIVGNMDNDETLVAENIVLTEAESGNNFYCPIAFTAKRISYKHNYSMITGFNTCQGWETLVLPFDVSMIVNAKGTELVPYNSWRQGSNLRPFWLYQMTESGWQAENEIKANVPYIISMPNNELYQSSYNIAGNIQFIGNSVEVKTSDNLTIGRNGKKRLVANYQNKAASSDIYALNVNNLWCQNTEAEREGSVFVIESRAVHPFEAYMTIEGGNAPWMIPVFDNGVPTNIIEMERMRNVGNEEWYDLQGRKLQGAPTKSGIYIRNGKKIKK